MYASLMVAATAAHQAHWMHTAVPVQQQLHEIIEGDAFNLAYDSPSIMHDHQVTDAA
jgi:hypothetical protein